MDIWHRFNNHHCLSSLSLTFDTAEPGGNPTCNGEIWATWQQSQAEAHKRPEDSPADQLDQYLNPFFVFYNAKRKEGDAAEEITQRRVGLGMRAPLEKAPPAAYSKPYASFGCRQLSAWAPRTRAESQP